MKRFLSIALMLSLFALMSGCHGFFYGPGRGHGHGGGWHHGPGHGGGHGPGHGRPGHGRGHGRGNHSIIESVNSLSADYSIKSESALAIANFAGGENSSEALAAIGATAEQMSPLADAQMPSQETVQAIADKLGEDQATIQKLLGDFISDVK